VEAGGGKEVMPMEKILVMLFLTLIQALFDE
jgi:hypothetical protein